MLVSILAAILIAAITAWVLGGLLLRLAGALGTAIGLLIAAQGNPVGLAALVLAVVVWAAGHWLWALRHHAFKSPLARRLYTQVLPERLDCTRRWAWPTTGPPRPRADRAARPR